MKNCQTQQSNLSSADETLRTVKKRFNFASFYDVKLFDFLHRKLCKNSSWTLPIMSSLLRFHSNADHKILREKKKCFQIMKSGVQKYLVCAIRSKINLNKDIKVPGWKARKKATIFLIAVVQYDRASNVSRAASHILRLYFSGRKRRKTRKSNLSFYCFRVLSFHPVYYWIYSNCILDLTANNFCSLNDWRRKRGKHWHHKMGFLRAFRILGDDPRRFKPHYSSALKLHFTF